MRGWCKRHYDRWRRAGTTDFPADTPLLDRLLARTDRVGDCLVWNGPSADPDGRGSVRWQGRADRAHRVVWEISHGAIPKGLVVRHTCDVAACLNVEHMLLGTQADNMRDKQDRGRGLWGVCRNGLHPLTGENVYILPSNPGYRECRACRKMRNHRYYMRRKAG